MKLVIFTRTGYHHTSFINRVQDEFDVVCVVREAYPSRTSEKSPSSSGDDIFLKEFHRRFSAGFTVHPFLKDLLNSPYKAVIKKPGTEYVDVECGAINSHDFTVFLKQIQPDIVAVLGSSVIERHIIDIPTVAMINLHSGIAPYYRGTWSYGWPVVNGEPEYIGVTVHHIDSGIDTGDIICQTKPVLDDFDDLNAIFLKVISEGIELVIKTIKDLLRAGTVPSYRQPDIGKHYTAQDFNADVARICLENLESGIIKKYNAERRKRDAVVKLYGYVPPESYT